MVDQGNGHMRASTCRRKMATRVATGRPHFGTGPIAALLLLGLMVPAGGCALTAGDDLGLLPSVSADHSPQMRQLRKCLAAGDLQCAQKTADEIIRTEPKNFEGYLWQSFLELQRDNGYEAVRLLRRAEVLDANPYVLKLLAFSYYTVRQFRLFLMKMNEAIQKQPGDYAPYYYIGRHYFADDVADYARAADYFRRALALHPTHYPSHYYLGWCNESMHRVADAEQAYRQSMELVEAAEAKFAGPYQGMARLRLLEDKPAEALPLARRAAEVAPDDAACHKLLAKALAGLGQQPEAIAEWERVAALDPTDAAPYYRLYRIYLAMGDEAKANAAHAKFSEISTRY